jgi:hypothetical protein
MAVVGRLHWIILQICAGSEVRTSSSYNDNKKATKIRFWIRPRPVGNSGYSVIQLRFVQFIMQIAGESLASDSGHKHSSGVSEVTIWLQDAISHGDPTRHSGDDMNDDGDDRLDEPQQGPHAEPENETDLNGSNQDVDGTFQSYSNTFVNLSNFQEDLTKDRSLLRACSEPSGDYLVNDFESELLEDLPVLPACTPMDLDNYQRPLPEATEFYDLAACDDAPSLLDIDTRALQISIYGIVVSFAKISELLSEPDIAIESSAAISATPTATLEDVDAFDFLKYLSDWKLAQELLVRNSRTSVAEELDGDSSEESFVEETEFPLRTKLLSTILPLIDRETCSLSRFQAEMLLNEMPEEEDLTHEEFKLFLEQLSSILKMDTTTFV